MAAALLAPNVALAADKVKVGVFFRRRWRDHLAGSQKVAARDGIDVQVIVFNDYLLPNAALDAGDLDLNAFQHKPFLENQVKTKGYKITAIADTVVSPIGLYSKKVKALAELKDSAQVGIPNDPSNGGRGLLLLAQHGLIKLKEGVGILPRVIDVTDNPKKLKFREIDAAQLARSLDDLDAAVINTNYALQANLKPGRDSIAIETTKDNPYGNVIAAREKDKDNPLYRRVVKAYQDEAIRSFIKTRFDGALLPVW
ncbi:dioxygenase [Elstera litoralis]|uniref:Dioxygenase n=1 Tax=Elstera litoralis TaxID=552518 RepID=A0A0F3IJP7_9PROT|nr:dioxygenase [Elstera litoralis]